MNRLLELESQIKRAPRRAKCAPRPAVMVLALPSRPPPFTRTRSMAFDLGEPVRWKVRAYGKPETQEDDVLAKHPPAAVAAWYSRLADNTEAKGARLSALLLRHWLKNRDPRARIQIAAHPSIIGSTPVTSGLVHHRQIYLTEEKASFQGGSERFAGIIPRLQSKKWDGSSPLSLEYQGLATSGNAFTAAAKYRAGLMSAADSDVFTSLHDFQLRTEVIATGRPAPKDRLQITFTSFVAQVLDRYDWDANKHLTVPNPDFQSKRSEAIEPTLPRIVVYHTNAKRIEAAGLAAPYDLTTDRWPVTDPAIIGPAIIDPKKNL